MAGDIILLFRKSSYEVTTYLKEVNNLDHSVLGTAQPAGNMIKKKHSKLCSRNIYRPLLSGPQFSEYPLLSSHPLSGYPLLSSHPLSGYPLLRGQLLKPQNYCQCNKYVNKTPFKWPDLQVVMTTLIQISIILLFFAPI